MSRQLELFVECRSCGRGLLKHVGGKDNHTDYCDDVCLDNLFKYCPETTERNKVMNEIKKNILANVFDSLKAMDKNLTIEELNNMVDEVYAFYLESNPKEALGLAETKPAMKTEKL